MRDLIFMLFMFHVVLFLLCLAGAILAKLHILHIILFEMAVSFFPEWLEANPGKHFAILAVLAVCPVLYWSLRIWKWRQEERMARADVLARARRITLQELQQMCEKQR